MKKFNTILLIAALFLLGNTALFAATYTVMNTGDAGAGSLRQAILDANFNAGADIIDFNISVSDSGYSDWTGTTFWWKITLESNLPDIEEDLIIDGFSQSINVSDSNAGVIGTGGTVGVDEIVLPQYEKPEIEIDANDKTEPIRIAVGTNNVVIQAISIFNSNGDAILARGNSMGNIIQQCLVGSRADGSEPDVGLKNEASGIRIHRSFGMTHNIGTINECYSAYNGNSGVLGSGNASQVQPFIGSTIIVEYCEVFENGWNSDNQDGIDGNGANNIIQYNLSYNNRSTEHILGAGSGGGIEVGGYTDLVPGRDTNNIISNNTCYGNDNHGIALMYRPTGDLVSKNIVRNNNGPGILVSNRHYYDPQFMMHTYTRYNKISQNSVFDNLGLGIDLCNVDVYNYINGDEVTFNDGTVADTLANEGVDFPVIDYAYLDGNSLTLKGFVGTAPNAIFANNTVEFFISSYDGNTNPNPSVSNDVAPYHGEGKTFFGTLVTDTNGNFDGILDVSSISIPINTNTWITATATDLSNNTSEFSENKQADDPVPVTLSSFTAIYENVPTLNWTTQSESNNLGWNVYRSLSENMGLANQINDLLIPGNGTTSEPTAYVYNDLSDVESNTTYWYWLESASYNGETELYGPVTLTIQDEENQLPELPTISVLHNNYPNPFNPSTMINFSISQGENGSLTIFNTKGQVMESHKYEAGEHQFNWDAAQYSSGIYFYKLETQNYTNIKKMIMVK